MANLTRPNWLKRCLTYGVAILAVAVAAIISALLQTYLQASPTLFVFLCAIIFAAWFGGVGPGLSATALSVLVFGYFFLPPIHSLHMMLSDLPRMALFVLAGLFVIALIAAQRNTAESLRRSRADLQSKVRDLEKLNAALQLGETYLAEAQRLSHTGSFSWHVSNGEILWSEESYRIFEYEPTTRVTIDIVLNRVRPDDRVLVRGVIDRRRTTKRHLISSIGC